MDLKVLFAGLAIVFLLVFGVTQYVYSSTPSNPTATPSAPSNAYSGAYRAPIEDGVQKVSLRALQTGVYDKPQILVKKGIPVELTFSADDGAGCGHGFMMRDFGIRFQLALGETKTVTFTPQNVGTFEYSCLMRMFRGALIVEA